MSIKEKRLVNRGFLKGPFLPIYGSGALCVLIVTIPVRGHIALMALTGMVSATLLEYVTGAVMERLFRVRYWDYTGKFMSVNGYICLESTICWGVMTILIVEGLHRYIANLVLAVNEMYITAVVLAITPVIAADFITSFHAAIHLRDILVQGERIRGELWKLIDRKADLERLLLSTGVKAKEQVLFVKEQAIQARNQIVGQTMQAKEQAVQEIQELLPKISELKDRMSITYGKSIRGLLRRNPKAVSRWHKEVFTELKQALAEKFSRK